MLREKTEHRQVTFDALDGKTKEAIEYVIKLVPNTDPFGIKECFLNLIASNNREQLNRVLNDVRTYKILYRKLIENEILQVINNSNLDNFYTEYQNIISEQPHINDEDYLYIEEIINTSMDKPLSVERKEDGRLHIFLSNEEFLEKSRDDLPLSTGEQNFLSLMFEFLKAKNSPCPIIVIDDPISSFDSIYKNRVVYAIVKMLHNKKRIVLTHNTDLIRLLDCQYKHCFKLYLFNNTDGGNNGFIPLQSKEEEMLINLKKLLSAFRNEVPRCVRNQELFLISMIPFMRGYATIIKNEEQESLVECLTNVMHGYKTEQVDIADAYTKLFEKHQEYLPDFYNVSVSDILCKSCNENILDDKQFPLLNRTLKHSFTYLFLRLKVEKVLVEKFNIDIVGKEQLGQIIAAAFPDENDSTQRRNRVFLNSKKTLINEFNHFEGNLSIFQPAIDISDQMLEKEKNDILEFLNSL